MKRGLTADYFLLLKVLKTLADNTEKKIVITYVLHIVTFRISTFNTIRGCQKKTSVKLFSVQDKITKVNVFFGVEFI